MLILYSFCKVKTEKHWRMTPYFFWNMKKRKFFKPDFFFSLKENSLRAFSIQGLNWNPSIGNSLSYDQGGKQFTQPLTLNLNPLRVCQQVSQVSVSCHTYYLMLPLLLSTWLLMGLGVDEPHIKLCWSDWHQPQLDHPSSSHQYIEKPISSHYRGSARDRD